MASTSIHVTLPTLASARNPTSLILSPLPLLQILTHSSHSTTSVIGALLGKRQDNGEVLLTGALGMVHDEAALYLGEKEFRDLVSAWERGGGRGEGEGVVGWYSTTPTPTPFSALIQNFFNAETAPWPAVHVTVDTSLAASNGTGVRGWLSAPHSPSPSESCLFLPIPLSLTPPSSLLPSLSALTSASSSPLSTEPSPLNTSSLSSFSSAISRTQSDLTKTLAYVDAVLAGEKEGDESLGRALWEGVASVGPSGGEEWEEGVRGVVQDTLMVVYLSGLVRTQVELSGRIALLQT